MIEKLLRGCIAPATLLTLATAAHADCMADLKSVMDKTMSGGSYHVDTKISSPGSNMEMKGNIIPPDQFDMTMPQGRMIMTRKGAWMQHGGKWMKMPDMMRKMVGSQVSVASAETMKNVSNLKCLGSKDFEGKTYTALDFDTAGNVMGINAKSHVTLYTENGKLAISEVDGEAMGHKSHTVQKITYDDSITIAEPK